MKRAAVISFLLLLAANHLDYLLQAYQHGWATWLVLDATAAKWGLLDFIPHDSWHICFWLYRLLLMTAPVVMWEFDVSAFNNSRTMKVLTVLAFYVITRAIAFSAFVKFMANR